MANPIAGMRIAPDLYDPIVQLRRTFANDIEQIREKLSDREYTDELTQVLRVWYDEFVTACALQNVEIETVLKKYLDLLEKILIIPNYRFPLDEESMLGSDGFAYGNKFLKIDRFKSGPPYNKRSPLKRNDPTPFSATPHEPARILVRFLKKYRPNFTSDFIDREFNQLPPEIAHPPEKKPVKELSIRERIEIIRQEEAERKAGAEEREQARQQQRAKIEMIVDKAINRQLENLNRQIDQNDERANARLDVIDEQFRGVVNNLQEQFNQVDLELPILESDISDLRLQLRENGEEISNAKNDNIRLEVGIKETEKAMKDREKGWLSELLQVAAVIGACAFASWALPEILSAMGCTTAKVAVSSVPHGLKVTATASF